MPDKIHQGQNIRRFREMLNIKQETLAHELGPDWSQKKVSLLEAKETIDQELLEQVAKVLKVPVKAIESFTEKGAATYFNTFEEGSSNQGNIGDNGTYIFNPIDKLSEALEENKRLYNQLLQEKDEKIALLQKLLDKK
ncbi:MAG: transcriptional regulator [Sphingobacteriales bacterium 50-39]|nr:MAG: transcriptional regulator [Sphingobacteriales bacterium 50-39]